MKYFLTPIFLTISFGCFGQTEPATDTIINNIKKQYHFIQDNLISYDTTKIEAPATAYYEGKQIKLIVFGEAEKNGVDYYFSNGKLFFAIEYNQDNDKKSVVSNQYYFSNRKLILWLDNDKKKVDLTLGTNTLVGQGLIAHSSKIKDEFESNTLTQTDTAMNVNRPNKLPIDISKKVAQTSSPIAELPQKVIISSGHCNSTCGYTNGFHNVSFNQELEYSLIDSTFRFRNKSNKSFKKLEIKPSAFFTESSTYRTLDTLYENFTDFKMNRGKYYIYKVELIYCKDKMGLPLKTKIMEFLVTTNPEKIHPPFIDKLVEEYKSVAFKL